MHHCVMSFPLGMNEAQQLFFKHVFSSKPFKKFIYRFFSYVRVHSCLLVVISYVEQYL